VKDWTLHSIIEDVGHSGKNLARPGIQRLLALMDAGAIEVVIIYKLDRLTWSVADLDHLVHRFERQGVALVSLQESLDATTATGRLMMNLLAQAPPSPCIRPSALSLSVHARAPFGQRPAQSRDCSRSSRVICRGTTVDRSCQ
jgi:Resolvase, N terminal domain